MIHADIKSLTILQIKQNALLTINHLLLFTYIQYGTISLLLSTH